MAGTSLRAKRDATVVTGKDDGEEDWTPNNIPADSPALKNRKDVFVDFDPYAKATPRKAAWANERDEPASPAASTTATAATTRRVAEVRGREEPTKDDDDDDDENDDESNWDINSQEAAERDASTDFFNFNNLPNQSSSVDPLARSTGSISDLTVKELVDDYNYPMPYIADMIMQFGYVKPPLDINSRLGDICSGTELFALLEVVNSVPGSEVANFYYTSNIAESCEEFGWDLKAVLKFCEEEDYSLPFGIRTVPRTDQIGALVRMFSSGGGLLRSSKS